MMQFDVLDGEYECFIDRCADDVLVGHIDHVHRFADGVRLAVQVARVSAHVDLGSELFLKHWCINLFLDSNVRYDARDSTTTIVTDPELQAGNNRIERERLISLRDSDLPYCNPDLPYAIGAALIQQGFCIEPVALHVHHSKDIDSVIAFGQVYDDD